MKRELTDQAQDLTVIGAALRTRPEDAARDIGPFWGKFMQSGAGGGVAGRIDDAVYAVYCDYESDWRGPYTLVLGVAVAPGTEPAAGQRRVRIPRGKYAQFIAAGDPQKVIWEAWQYINGDWSERAQRRYIADFERYTPGAFASGVVRAEINVGL